MRDSILKVNQINIWGISITASDSFSSLQYVIVSMKAF